MIRCFFNKYIKYSYNIQIFITIKRKFTINHFNLNINDKVTPFFKNLNKKIIYIDKIKKCKYVINEIRQILAKEKYKYMAIDLEGYKIGRFGILSILQLCIDDIYIFDLYNCDDLYMFIYYLKDILEDKQIIKIMHDCREDCSILYNQFNINLNNVFDTQMAYTLILKKEKKELYQISLDELLSKLIFLNNDYKFYFHKMIKINEKIYLKRPLSNELIMYAILDVIYLKPLMFHLLDYFYKLNLKKQNILIEKKHIYHLNDEMKEIMKYIIIESEKYVNYQLLNSHINEENLQKGQIIDAMVVSKNKNIYAKLNMTKKGILSIYKHEIELNQIIKCIILDLYGPKYLHLGIINY